MPESEIDWSVWSAPAAAGDRQCRKTSVRCYSISFTVLTSVCRPGNFTDFWVTADLAEVTVFSASCSHCSRPVSVLSGWRSSRRKGRPGDAYFFLPPLLLFLRYVFLVRTAIICELDHRQCGYDHTSLSGTPYSNTGPVARLLLPTDALKQRVGSLRQSTSVHKSNSTASRVVRNPGGDQISRGRYRAAGPASSARFSTGKNAKLIPTPLTLVCPDS